MNRQLSSPGLAAALCLLLAGCDGKPPVPDSSRSAAVSSAPAVTPLKLTTAGGSIVPEESGARPGVWTADLTAAKKTAAEKDLPILLYFTGSDWCKYCRRLSEDVFTRDAWKNWASRNLVLVYLDFPQNPRKLPKELLERNQNLRKEFGVQSLPTLVLLDSQAGYINPVALDQANTPGSVMRTIKTLLYRCESNVKKTIGTLPPDDPVAAELKRNMDRIDETRKTLDKETAAFQERQRRLGELLQEHSQKLQLAMTELALRNVSPEQKRKYEETKKLYVETQKNFQEWLKTNPQQSQDNMVTYSTFIRNIQEQKNILDDIVAP